MSLRSSVPALVLLAACADDPTGAPRLIDLDDGEQIALWETSWAVRSPDSPDLTEARPLDHKLYFRRGAVDPQLAPIRDPASAGDELYLVQFETPVRPAYRRALARLGATAHRYFPATALLVTMDAAARDRVRALPFVRWVGPYEPANRLAVATATGGRFLLLPTTTSRDLATQLRAAGVTVYTTDPGAYLVDAELTAAQLATVSTWPSVVHIDRWSTAGTDMDLVRQFAGLQTVEDNLGFRGAGVTAEVMDVNVDETHPDITGRVTFRGSRRVIASGHGTAAVGIIIGDGTGDARARGILPEGNAIFSQITPFLANPPADRRRHTAALLEPPYEALFQTNSWGHALTTSYTNISAEFDSILFDLDILVFNSQSNGGSQFSRPEAWAKNVVSVGGLFHRNTLSRNDDYWGSLASIGPAEDGRIKPDLAHFVDRVWAPTEGTGYKDFTGTSAATPITAGLAGVMMQMWGAGLFGNAVSGDTLFERRPHAMTAKALLINTATQWSFSGANADRGRMKQGWGAVDAGRMYSLRNSIFVVNETDVLAPQGKATYRLTVPSRTPELRATLAFADPPGVPGAAHARVNDLTLVVTAPNGTVYYGNNGLAAAMTSSSGGSPNTVDTVENVILSNPAAGTWTFEVRADEINEDGHPETAELDADFALVVSGIRRDTLGANAAPLVSLDVSDSFATGAITVTADADDTDGSIAFVRFGLPDGTFVDDATPPYTAQWDATTSTGATLGFTAIAFDDRGATSAATVAQQR